MKLRWRVRKLLRSVKAVVAGSSPASYTPKTVRVAQLVRARIINFQTIIPLVSYINN